MHWSSSVDRGRIIGQIEVGRYGGKMNDLILEAYKRGRLMLLLGAGASMTSFDSNDRLLPSGRALAEELAQECGLQFNGESLSRVYRAAKNNLGTAKLDSFFAGRLLHCKPSAELNLLAKFPFSRIYTLNLDDTLERALNRNSQQKVSVRVRKERVTPEAALLDRIDIIKLNGSADRPNEGYIFSDKEYADESASPSAWYTELASDYFNNTFLFIGTQLEESALEHHMAMLRVRGVGTPPKHFVLLPKASEIDIESWEAYNIKHLAGTLSDFASFLSKSFREPPKPIDIAVSKNPALGELRKLPSAASKTAVLDKLSYIYPISFRKLEQSTGTTKANIRPFYRGFKPTWDDIRDEIPASLRATGTLTDVVRRTVSKASERLIAVLGPAGSGKSTLLKQCAYSIAISNTIDCYFLDEGTPDFAGTLAALESIHPSRFLLCIDRLDPFSESIASYLQKNSRGPALIVGCERSTTWRHRTSDHLKSHAGAPFLVETIDSSDAEAILEKVQKYGPWTRLAKLSAKQRKSELIDKAKKQLLIGLMETTSGEGYPEIIRSEYNGLEKEEAKRLLQLVGVATVNSYPVKISHLLRACSSLGLSKDILAQVDMLPGILRRNMNLVEGRHPVYFAELFANVIPKVEVAETVHSFLHAYSAYEPPILRSIDKAEGRLFKAVINHRFLRRLLKDNNDLVLGIYESLEKIFERDGLFLLQYGLALRAARQQRAALDKLQTAVVAYANAHTEHALALQQLIVASQSDSAPESESLLALAKETLLHLDKTLESLDTYPIVTLAEWHTVVLRRLEGEQAARKVATHYVNLLAPRTNSADRVQEAHDRLFKYAATGQLREEDINLLDE